MWDQIDGVLLAWLDALAEIAAGAMHAVARFPDTRIECELRRVDADTVAVRYEDVDTTLPMGASQQALLSAAQRLLAAAPDHTTTAALVHLHRHRSEER